MHRKFDTIPDRSDPEYTRPPESRYAEGGDVDFRRHQATNHVITQRLVDRISGSGPGQETLYGVNPKVRCFAATLASQYRFQEEQQEAESDGEDAASSITKNVAPFSTGLRLRIDPDELDGPLGIQPKSRLYVKRFPTYEEQLQYSGVASATPDEDDDEFEDVDPDLYADGGKVDVSSAQPLVDVYERVDPTFEEIQISKAQLRNAASSGDEITATLSGTLDEAREAVVNDSDTVANRKDDVSYDDATKVPPRALEDESAFEQHLDSTFSDEKREPLWSAEVRVEVDRRENGEYDIVATLINTHGEDFESAEEADEEWQTFLFDASIAVEAPGGAFQPFESQKIKGRYEYDGDIWGLGKNCSAEPVTSDPVTKVVTDLVPIHQQPKYVSRETIDAPFEALAEGDFGTVLNRIEDEMRRAYDQYEGVRQEITEPKNDDAKKSFDKMLAQFESERDRFQLGKELLLDESNEDARTAFAALNRTFDQMGPEYKHWRLFQLVYIVMSIPDIVSQSSPQRDIQDSLDVCDIIFFPTGGGKTEAYLGLVVFAAFLDRLRGKDFGMTALTKFPLRLLSLQQLQRITEVLCCAELIRRDHEDMGGERFSVGYFVGKNNTPNAIEEDGENVVRLAKESEEHKDKWLIVPECPFCGEESVEITGDLERLRIVHQCTNPECEEVQHQGGDTAELPVYVVDNEVYRYVPTFVVSTIDKIAIFGQNRRSRGLLGQVKHRCPDHGYTTEEGCLVAGRGTPEDVRCNHDTPAGMDPVEPADPPSILIQDELHLLREEFGAFDSHYETFIQELIHQYTDGEWEMKVVAATATIEGAQNQVQSLYRKEPNEFPSRGPRLKQSFYAYEDPHRLGRQMIGAIPRSVGPSRAMNIVMREYAKITQWYDSHPDQLYDDIDAVAEDVVAGPLSFDSDPETRRREILDVLDDYKVQIAYTISKSQSDLLNRSIKQMINEQLAEDGEEYERLTPVSMTGETDMETVRDALSRLEADDPDEPIDAVVATNMISHGVDVDRFNFMSFHGMPRNTAEYIQAYSRVGRKYTGSVFLLFNAMRARDRSHYGRFDHYHQYQDLLVEATPLERWAEYAIECTLPGVVVGLLLQYYDLHYETDFKKRIYNVEGLREAVKTDVVKKDELREMTFRAYDVQDATENSGGEIGARIYRERIDQQFDKIWSCLMNADPVIHDPRNAGLKNFIGNILADESEEIRKPMRSLRDIDEQIPVTLDLATKDMIDTMIDRGEFDE